MTKKIFSLFLLLLAPFLLSACGSPVNTNTKTNESVNSKNDEFRRPDFGQPESRPDINGLVKSITGNEVVILKVEIGQGLNRASSTPANDSGSAPLSLGTASRVPGAGPGMGGGLRGADTAENRDQMMAKLKEMSTGEEKIIIPVGIKMLKRSSDENSREMVEAALSDISNDKMMMIWLNSTITDRKVASFIVIN